MFHSGTNWNRRGASRSYPGRFLPQPEQIARLLARGSISTSSSESTKPSTKRIRV
jgi:hypothetical protein